LVELPRSTGDDGFERVSHWGSSVRTLLSFALALCLFGLIYLAPGVGPAASDPFSGAGSGPSTAQSLVEKAHGFHCRKMLGWDPVGGVYRMHSHAGICRNYPRCLREHRRCIFILGGGFEEWSFERFGSENYRYTDCMLRAGCY
jgi:hypothetical protein